VRSRLTPPGPLPIVRFMSSVYRQARITQGDRIWLGAVNAKKGFNTEDDRGPLRITEDMNVSFARSAKNLTSVALRGSRPSSVLTILRP